MEFNPNNPIIQLCVQGMGMQDTGNPEKAYDLFLQAWREATNDFEKYLAAYYVARSQENISDKLKWYETALQFALNINDVAVKGALPAMYLNIAQCHEEIGNVEEAKQNQGLAVASAGQPADDGPFYHGTRADLPVGEFLVAGHLSNYKDEFQMNHIYFTALANGAGLAASLAKGEGRERVYIVELTGSFENDPNLTDKKFPGNLTRSYRTTHPLRIIGEVSDWTKQTPEDVQKWRDKLANNKGEIIN